MGLSVLIVDDEPAARRGLRRLLMKEQDVSVVGECGDGASAIAAIGELHPDLVLLDIQMPELGGFEVIDAIGLQKMPTVIFVTAYDAHALRAFDVHALDYVLKPVDRERFQSALQRARRHVVAKSSDRIVDALRDLGREPASRFAKRLAIKSLQRVLLVEIEEVGAFTAAGNYVEVHTAAKTHLLRETLSDLESRIDPERFVRVSRSSIVRIDHIREVHPAFNGDAVLVLRDGTRIAASRRYRARWNLVLE